MTGTGPHPQPPQQEPEYVPEIPSLVTNMGAAYWTLERSPRGVRLFARWWPPLWSVIIGLMVSAAVVLMIAFLASKTSADNRTSVIALGSLAGVIGLGGIWGALLLGNINEAVEPDLLQLDSMSHVLSLPRSGRQMPTSSVVRIEMVKFWVRFTTGRSVSYLGVMHLVLVSRDESGRVQFDVLLNMGSPMRSVGQRLAKELQVPFVRRKIGTFDPPR